jgi:hypothetical protein
MNSTLSGPGHLDLTRAAQLARLLGVQEAPGSSPGSPTTIPYSQTHQFAVRLGIHLESICWADSWADREVTRATW